MGTRTMDIAYADCVNSVSLHPRFIEYNLLSAMVQELGLCHLQFSIASVPGFSFMQYGCGAEKTAKKKKSLVDFDHVGTVTCNGMQFCHTWGLNN